MPSYMALNTTRFVLGKIRIPEPGRKAPYALYLMHRMIWQRFAIALQVSTGAKDLSVYFETVCNICKVLEETGSL